MCHDDRQNMRYKLSRSDDICDLLALFRQGFRPITSKVVKATKIELFGVLARIKTIKLSSIRFSARFVVSIVHIFFL